MQTIELWDLTNALFLINLLLAKFGYIMAEMKLALQWDRLDLRALSDPVCFVYNII